MELPFPGAWNFRSRERKFNGTFVPGSKISLELIAKVPNELLLPKGKKFKLQLRFFFISIDVGLLHDCICLISIYALCECDAPSKHRILRDKSIEGSLKY